MPSYKGTYLALAAVVRNASILGTFTDFRVSDYAQDQPVKVLPFSTVTFNAANSSNGGHPIALILQDFSFFSSAHPRWDSASKKSR